MMKSSNVFHPNKTKFNIEIFAPVLNAVHLAQRSSEAFRRTPCCQRGVLFLSAQSTQINWGQNLRWFWSVACDEILYWFQRSTGHIAASLGSRLTLHCGPVFGWATDPVRTKRYRNVSVDVLDAAKKYLLLSADSSDTWTAMVSVVVLLQLTAQTVLFSGLFFPVETFMLLGPPPPVALPRTYLCFFPEELLFLKHKHNLYYYIFCIAPLIRLRVVPLISTPVSPLTFHLLISFLVTLMIWKWKAALFVCLNQRARWRPQM